MDAILGTLVLVAFLYGVYRVYLKIQEGRGRSSGGRSGSGGGKGTQKK